MSRSAERTLVPVGLNRQKSTQVTISLADTGTGGFEQTEINTGNGQPSGHWCTGGSDSEQTEINTGNDQPSGHWYRWV